MKPECRVLQVVATLGVGGAEVWLLELLKFFREVEDDLPFKLRIDICLTGEPGPLEDQAVALGARLIRIPYSRKTLPTFITRFRKLLATRNYHAIHDHQDYVAGLHFLFGLGHLPPVRIAHVHNPPMNLKYLAPTKTRRAVLSTGKNLLAPLATHVLGTSRQVLSEYGFDDDRFRRTVLSAAHCGFDVSRFAGDCGESRSNVRSQFGWPENTKLLLFVGRLNSNCNQKNPRFAIEVGKECISHDPNVRVLMVGGGDEARCELETQVKTWGLAEQIRFAGVRPDVPRLMLAADALLFPSVAEGLGMVTVEAQAAGLPVLASDTTPRECVVVSGLVDFLSLADGTAAWAKHALHILSLPRMNSEACNDAVRNSPFSIQNSAMTLLDVYSSANRKASLGLSDAQDRRSKATGTPSATSTS